MVSAVLAASLWAGEVRAQLEPQGGSYGASQPALEKKAISQDHCTEPRGRGRLQGVREKQGSQTLSAEKSVLWNSRGWPALC